jgi:hypothetical protein
MSHIIVAKAVRGVRPGLPPFTRFLAKAENTDFITRTVCVSVKYELSFDVYVATFMSVMATADNLKQDNSGSQAKKWTRGDS